MIRPPVDHGTLEASPEDGHRAIARQTVRSVPSAVLNLWASAFLDIEPCASLHVFAKLRRGEELTATFASSGTGWTCDLDSPAWGPIVRLSGSRFSPVAERLTYSSRWQLAGLSLAGIRTIELHLPGDLPPSDRPACRLTLAQRLKALLMPAPR